MNFNHHDHPMDLLTLPLLVQSSPSPNPVKDNSKTSIVTAIETAGSGADDKVCINFATCEQFMY